MKLLNTINTKLVSEETRKAIADIVRYCQDESSSELDLEINLIETFFASNQGLACNLQIYFDSLEANFLNINPVTVKAVFTLEEIQSLLFDKDVSTQLQKVWDCLDKYVKLLDLDYGTNGNSEMLMTISKNYQITDFKFSLRDDYIR